jgi:hypothetical protein
LVVEDSVLLVVAVMAAVKEAVAVEEDRVVAEEAEALADAGAMAQQTAPQIANSMPNPTPTAGPVGLMSPKSMIAKPVTTKHKDTKIQ